mgnify:FL=1
MICNTMRWDSQSKKIIVIVLSKGKGLSWKRIFLKEHIVKLFLNISIIKIIIIIIGKSFHSGSTTITCEFFAESSRDCKSQVFWTVWYYNRVSEKRWKQPILFTGTTQPLLHPTSQVNSNSSYRNVAIATRSFAWSSNSSQLQYIIPASWVLSK